MSMIMRLMQMTMTVMTLSKIIYADDENNDRNDDGDDDGDDDDGDDDDNNVERDKVTGWATASQTLWLKTGVVEIWHSYRPLSEICRENILFFYFLFGHS